MFIKKAFALPAALAMTLMISSSVCLAEDAYEQDVENTAERQDRIDAEEAVTHNENLERRREAAVDVDGADSVEAAGIEAERERVRRE